MRTPATVEGELCWALGTVMRHYLRTAGEALKDVPGGPKGFLVLSSLGTGEPSTQAALAQHLGVDRTMMTYLLDDLDDAGLVERRPDPADRRARRVSLTDAGAARLAEFASGLHDAEDELLRPREPAECAQLRDLLRRLAVALAPVTPCQVMDSLRTDDTRHGRRQRRR